MSGIKGMKRASAANAARRQIWSSIRIMRRFTLPDLMRTVPGATMSNVINYVGRLAKHGYVSKVGKYTGGRRGDSQPYQLIRNTGSSHPTICDVCGQSLAVKFCLDPKKETEKEKETNKEKETEVRHDQP